MDDDKILVDGEPVLKAKLDLISKKILKNCNYLHSKSKNNPATLKNGSGKSSITSGMTVNEFAKRFNLPI